MDGGGIAESKVDLATDGSQMNTVFQRTRYRTGAAMTDDEVINWYADRWRNALKLILKWNDEQPSQYISTRLNAFSDGKLMLLHDPPMRDVAITLAQLVQPPVKDSRIYLRLSKEIQVALEQNPAFAKPGAENKEAEAILNLQRVLSKHEVTLPC
jgi:hypothetical protein